MSDFDISSKCFIPKCSTQQNEFLKKYPKFDGRGIVIAIIDTCVDVSLPGLQKTTTGLPKIIDCFNFTGNGNVDTSIVKQINGQTSLVGLTGRILKIPQKWINPSGKWHLGIKSLSELFDETATEKIIELRKHNICEQNEILEDNIIQQTMNNNQEKFNFHKSTEDLPVELIVADCIVWYDGKKWQACIDTSFVGNLETLKPLTNYRDLHEFDLIFDICAYCVTIHENGNLLELFVPFKDHGSLVANVAAGHYPNEPEKDGTAPGAQIISMGVLDPKINGLLNVQAAVAAFQKCIEMKVDIINYSITAFPASVYPIMKELVDKHGVIIIKSAGNHGPVYSSIYDIPTDLLDTMFIIGSCEIFYEKKDILSNIDTVEDEHSFGAVSSFSSRGPISSNGFNGVTFLAPGYGITDKPKYYSNKNEIFNATSFSTPNAAGAIACLISGLNANNLFIAPFKLRTALANTALRLENDTPLAYGNGIIQIDKAFEYFQSNMKDFSNDVKNISFFISSDEKCFSIPFVEKYRKEVKGIFLIKENERSVYKYDVKVETQNFLNDHPRNILWKFKLSITGAENFSTLSKTSCYNIFSLEINTDLLESDSINYAEIHGTDSLNPNWGTLFKFPITLIVPGYIQRTEKMTKTLNFPPNKFHRFYFIPPLKSSHCIIRVTALQNTDAELKFEYYSENEYIRIKHSSEIQFNPDTEVRTGCVKVAKNNLHEICVYRDLGCKQYSKFYMKLRFFGITMINSLCLLKNYLNYLPLLNNNRRHCIKLKNELNPLEYTSISVQFDKITYKLKEVNAEFEVINQKYFLLLTYDFEVPKQTQYKFNFILPDDRFTPYTVQKIQIFTESKELIMAFCDKKITLPPGKYLIKAFFEYQESEQLFYRILSYFIPHPIVTVTMYLEELSTPMLNSNLQNNNINQEMIFERGQTLKVFYDMTVVNDVILSSSVPLVSVLKGRVKIELESTSIDVKFKQKYFNSKYRTRRIINWVKGIIKILIIFFAVLTCIFYLTKHIFKRQGQLNYEKVFEVLFYECMLAIISTCVYHRIISLSELNKRETWKIYIRAVLIIFALILIFMTHMSYIFYYLPLPPEFLIAEICFLAFGIYLHFVVFLFLLFLIECLSSILIFVFQKWIPSMHFTLPYLKTPILSSKTLHTSIALILGIALTVQGYIATRMEPTVKHLNLLIKDLPQEFHGFSIVLVSDIHTGPTVGKAKVAQIVQIINDLNPDIITVDGDLSDGYIKYIGERIKPLKNLKAKYGKFATVGNHEYFYDNVDDWIKFYQKELNLTMFINDGKVFERNGKKICLAGLDDYYTEGAKFIGHSMNTTKALQNCPDKIPTIIMAHQPKGAAKVITDLSKMGRKADVILSGHTHGGQLVVVYPIGLALVDYFFGLYVHRESGTLIYVSSGVNYWGPPVKMWPTLCEIVKIRLLSNLKTNKKS